MFPRQVARAHEEHHARAFGYDKSNVTFTKGVIEDLEAAGVAANSVDIIVSNCVINLSEDKAAVLAQAHRALKEGGEMYFSDVYADRRIPGALGAGPPSVGAFDGAGGLHGRREAVLRERRRAGAAG